MTDEKMMTSKEVGDLLQIDPESIVIMAKRGDLPGVKIGRVWRFRRSDIDRMFDAAVEKQKPQPVTR